MLISNGWCEAVGIKDAGFVLSSEKCIVVVIRIIRQLAEKADAFDLVEGSSPVCQNCVDIPDDELGAPRGYQCTGHHRSLRPGHVSTGVIWELGRAICLLVN